MEIPESGVVGSVSLCSIYHRPYTSYDILYTIYHIFSTPYTLYHVPYTIHTTVRSALVDVVSWASRRTD